MNAQDLKNSILQLAVQGKLVEQRPEEGTAKELLAQIKAEKEKLIKDKKIKKEKPLPEITEDEIPFEIPESWEWVRLSEIVSFKMGKTPPRGDDAYWGNDYKWVSISDMQDGRIISDTKEGVTGKAIQDKFKEIIPNGTMLMSFKLTVGKVSILGVDAVHNEAIISIFPYVDKDYLFRNYLFKILPYMSVYGETKKAIMGFTLNSDSLSKLMIPIPPLAEQMRIVAKIEELLPYVEQYDKAYTKLESFNIKFPEDMKKSILQMAMQGKLVEQRPEEGTAEELYEQIVAEKARLIKEGKIKKEKPIDKVLDDSIPWEVPVTWKWVRFCEVTISRDAERIPLSVSEREMLAKEYDYYGASGIIDKVDRYLFDEDLLLIGEDGANLLNRSTPIAFIARGKYWVNNHAHVLGCVTGVDMEYLSYYINSISLAKYVTGTAQPKMNQARMNGIWVPLPPIAEQKRIVAKLEQMLPYCDRLMN